MGYVHKIWTKEPYLHNETNLSHIYETCCNNWFICHCVFHCHIFHLHTPNTWIWVHLWYHYKHQFVVKYFNNHQIIIFSKCYRSLDEPHICQTRNIQKCLSHLELVQNKVIVGSRKSLPFYSKQCKNIYRVHLIEIK